MGKLKSLKKIIMTVFLSIWCIIAVCQDGPKKGGKIANVDSGMLSLVKLDEYKFNIKSNDIKLLEINLWNYNRIGSLVIPLNDSIAERFNFSYSKRLVSKRQLKLIDGKYMEDGEALFFDDNGKISHLYTYSRGKLFGTYISYHSNGNIECKGSYKNGNKSGYWNYYDVKGVSIKKIKF